MQKIAIFIVGLVSLVSLNLGLAVPAYADQISDGLCTGANLQFTDNPTPGQCSSTDATSSIDRIVHTVINLLSAVVGIVAVIMIIVGGLRYITSGGNDTSVTSAKNTILYAIIGLIIVAFAQILVRFTLSKVTNS